MVYGTYGDVKIINFHLITHHSLLPTIPSSVIGIKMHSLSYVEINNYTENSHKYCIYLILCTFCLQLKMSIFLSTAKYATIRILIARHLSEPDSRGSGRLGKSIAHKALYSPLAETTLLPSFFIPAATVTTIKFFSSLISHP